MSKRSSSRSFKTMFWYCGLLSFLLLLGDAYGDVSKSRVRRQDLFAQNGQLIDNIFNIPITAIKQTAAAAQVFSPENSQTIDSVFKIPVSTLEAVGTLVKTTTERRQQNAENIQNIRQERRERLMAIKERKRNRKEEIRNQRLLQQKVTRVVRHFNKDPLGLNAWTDLLVGHHNAGFFGHHFGLGGHGGHGHHGGQSGHPEKPQHTYEVHENVDEDSSFSWHGFTAGFGSISGTRPTTAVKIENKIAPKEKKQKVPGYPNSDVNPQNKIARIRNKPENEYDPPIENKIAPRSGRVKFV